MQVIPQTHKVVVTWCNESQLGK